MKGSTIRLSCDVKLFPAAAMSNTDMELSKSSGSYMTTTDFWAANSVANLETFHVSIVERSEVIL